MTDSPPIVLRRSSTPLASIVISVSAGVDLLLACLRSLAMSIPDDVPYETIVVLNALDAEDAALIDASATGIDVIESDVNLGVAGGSNAGREAARGIYIVLLHDDALAEPGWLEGLVDAATRHPEAGAIGSMVLDPDGTLQNAGMILWRDGNTSRPWLGEPPSPEAFSESRLVDYCGTSSLLIRSALWDSIGGLDERLFPAYYVDVDVCMAVRARGFSVLYEPRSRIRHHRGASTRLQFRAFVAGRNRTLFIEKWAAELAEQCAPDPSDPAGSIERAKLFAANRPRHVGEPGASAAGPAGREAIGRRQRHLRLDRQIRKAFETHLIERLERAESRYLPLDYSLGASLSFAQTGPSWRYVVGDGCYDAEDWGSWLRRAQVTIVLPLTSAPLTPPPTLRLSVEAIHFLGEHRKASPLKISVNGTRVLDVVETEKAKVTYRADIPPGCYSATRCLVLQIDVADAVSPFEAGLSPDARPLSVGLSTLRVDVADLSGVSSDGTLSRPE